MTYQSAHALRTALEDRLLKQSTAGISLDRLRRRVMFERIIARIQKTEPAIGSSRAEWHSKYASETTHG